jgi:hypothetical protein
VSNNNQSPARRAGTGRESERTLTLIRTWSSASQFQSSTRTAEIASAARGPTTSRRVAGSMRTT